MSHRSQLKLYDFDSTLFDMPAFIAALPQAAHDVFGIESEHFAEELNDFYQKAPSGHAIGYDIEAHFAHYGIDIRLSKTRQKLADGILSAHKAQNGRPNLLFPEVAQVLTDIAADPETDAAILSVNLPSGYEFKRRLCGGLLDDIYAEIIPDNKGEWLTNVWRNGIIFNGVTYDTATVYDDSPAQIEAVPERPEITRIQVYRPGQRYPRNDSGIPTVDSLQSVPK